jgi:hypothetical protein
MTIESTQPVTEMNARNVPGGKTRLSSNAHSPMDFHKDVNEVSLRTHKSYFFVYENELRLYPDNSFFSLISAVMVYTTLYFSLAESII